MCVRCCHRQTYFRINFHVKSLALILYQLISTIRLYQKWTICSGFPHTHTLGHTRFGAIFLFVLVTFHNTYLWIPWILHVKNIFQKNEWSRQHLTLVCFSRRIFLLLAVVVAVVIVVSGDLWSATVSSHPRWSESLVVWLFQLNELDAISIQIQAFRQTISSCWCSRCDRRRSRIYE